MQRRNLCLKIKKSSEVHLDRPKREREVLASRKRIWNALPLVAEQKKKKYVRLEGGFKP
jgi:hypothetical protein